MKKMKKRATSMALFLSVWTAVASAKFETQTVKSFPSVDGKHIVALTIDDGPTSEVTDAILDILKENDVRATFFMLGKNAQKHPEIVKRVALEGHLIANHTWDHKWLLEPDPVTKKWGCRADESFAYNEIRATHDVLKPYIPKHQKRMYFRPPGGGWCGRDTAMMNADPELAKYVGPLYWTLGGSVWYENPSDPTSALKDAGDEDCWTSAHLSVSRCLEGYRASVKRRNGGVMLVHDVHMESAELLRVLIPELKKQGYTFVTMDEMSDFSGAPGTVSKTETSKKTTPATSVKKAKATDARTKKLLEGAGLY